MTRSEMVTWFNILQDKFDTPYFTDSEKYNFLNDAQLNYINRLLSLDENKRIRLEESIIANAALQTIIISGSFSTTSSSVITRATLKTQLSISEDIITPLAFATSLGVPIKFVRFNDLYNLLNSSGLKTPTTAIPVYTLDSGGYSFYPTGAEYTSVKAMVLKMPVDITSSVDCELPEFTHRKIVAMAMVKTGFVTESQSTALMSEATDG